MVNNTDKKSIFKKIFSLKTLLLTLVILLTTVTGLTIGFLSNLVKDQPILSRSEMKEKISDISINSDVYFSNGEKVATINSEMMRKSIPLSEMGDNVKKAIIASEDSDFYSNIGIEPLAIIRATYGEINGSSASGGSTITQQLVKNQLLDNSRSYKRKAKEILLSLRVNKLFEKNEILESYLNMAPFGKNRLGQNISGIETAAIGVFGIKSKDLNIAQAAYLAGFVQLPFKYTPFDGNGNTRSDEELAAGFARQKYVLDRMLSEDFITKTEYEEAINFDIKNSFIQSLPDESTKYPYIINEVITSAGEILAEQAAKKNNELEKYNSDKEFKNSLVEKYKTEFVTGGYKVKTTIVKDLYDKLETAKNNYTGFVAKNIGGTNYPMELGATLIENNTGKILAFIGGRDFNIQQLNHATRTTRSPGSTIKPLLVYAPAIEKGYITPNSQVLDRRFNYNGWTPENIDKTEYGVIPARKALAQSLNLSTIRLYSAFYNENPMKEYLSKMNFKNLSETDYSTLAAAIGGLTNGVTVTENTNAFATFANGGKYKQAYIIEEIIDKNGESIYNASFPAVQVYSEATSYLMVNMLHDVLTNNGTAGDISAALKFNNNNLYAKTGTSEYNHDGWVVGGSKNITFGLWTGYDRPSELPGFSHAHNQWAYFMNIINEYDPNLVGANDKFIQPTSVDNIKINPNNNDKGYVTDIVPTNFVKLDNNKVLRKYGSVIDKNIQNTLNSLYEKNKTSENDKDNNKDKENQENSVDSNNNNQTSNSTSSSNNNANNIIIVPAEPNGD